MPLLIPHNADARTRARRAVHQQAFRSETFEVLLQLIGAEIRWHETVQLRHCACCSACLTINVTFVKELEWSLKARSLHHMSLFVLSHINLF